MTLEFIFQLILSFIIGGCFIAFLSLLAERTNENVSGIIMMFPTTIVLGFFFLGFTTSAEKVAQIVPATLIPLGVIILSAVIYIHIAGLISNFISSRIGQITATFILSSLIWFVLAAPFAIWKFENLIIGIIGYFLLIAIAHYFLNKKKQLLLKTQIAYTKIQILLRALFMGAVIATVVLFGKILNPFWGGIFTMFPAATFAALVNFHFYYSPDQLFFFFKKIPLGSISLFIYAVSVMIFFPKFGIVLGTFFSYLICFLFTITLVRYKLKSVS